MAAISIAIAPVSASKRAIRCWRNLESAGDEALIEVFIGRENSPAEMRDVSLVLAPYGRSDRAVGVVGILGPTRMAYSQAIGTVRFVSGLMNELVEHLYA